MKLFFLLASWEAKKHHSCAIKGGRKRGILIETGFGLAFCGNIILSLLMWAQKSLPSLGRNKSFQSVCSGIKAAIDVQVYSENSAYHGASLYFATFSRVYPLTQLFSCFLLFMLVVQ